MSTRAQREALVRLYEALENCARLGVRVEIDWDPNEPDVETIRLTIGSPPPATEDPA